MGPRKVAFLFTVALMASPIVADAALISTDGGLGVYEGRMT